MSNYTDLTFRAPIPDKTARCGGYHTDIHQWGSRHLIVPRIEQCVACNKLRMKPQKETKK